MNFENNLGYANLENIIMMLSYQFMVQIDIWNMWFS